MWILVATFLFHLDPQCCLFLVSLIVTQLTIFGSFLGPKLLGLL